MRCPPAPLVDGARVHAPRIVVTSEAYRTTSGGAAARDARVNKPYAMRNRTRMKALVQLERKYMSTPSPYRRVAAPRVDGLSGGAADGFREGQDGCRGGVR